MAKFETIPVGQRLEGFRKAARRRYPGSVQKNWDNWNVSLECSSDLQADEVLRIVKSWCSLMVGYF
jgi:hypothetical protein